MAKLGANVFETSVVQVKDEFAITVDYAARLLLNEEVTSVAIIIFDKANVDKTADILNGAATIRTGASTNSEVLFNVHALIDAERYNAQLVATTNAAIPQNLEVDVFIPVKKIATVLAA